MTKLINYSGSIAGALGILICAAAGLYRLMGNFHFAGYELLTLFMAGLGLIILACYLRLELLVKTSATR